ncbi:hypothetical protein CsSME_00033631 [Camellia sinensis var. sinensis]
MSSNIEITIIPLATKHYHGHFYLDQKGFLTILGPLDFVLGFHSLPYLFCHAIDVASIDLSLFVLIRTEKTFLEKHRFLFGSGLQISIKDSPISTCHWLL